MIERASSIGHSLELGVLRVEALAHRPVPQEAEPLGAVLLLEAAVAVPGLRPELKIAGDSPDSVSGTRLPQVSLMLRAAPRRGRTKGACGRAT